MQHIHTHPCMLMQANTHTHTLSPQATPTRYPLTPIHPHTLPSHTLSSQTPLHSHTLPSHTSLHPVTPSDGQYHIVVSDSLLP